MAIYVYYLFKLCYIIYNLKNLHNLNKKILNNLLIKKDNNMINLVLYELN